MMTRKEFVCFSWLTVPVDKHRYSSICTSHYLFWVGYENNYMSLGGNGRPVGSEGSLTDFGVYHGSGCVSYRKGSVYRNTFPN